MNRARHWYYRKSAEEPDGAGPFDVNEMREHYKTGQLEEMDEIRDNSFEWKYLRDHSLLALIRAPQPKVKPRIEKPVEPVEEAPPEEALQEPPPEKRRHQTVRAPVTAPERRRGGKNIKDRVTGRNWYNLRMQYRVFTIMFQILLLHILLIFSDVILVINFGPTAFAVASLLLVAGFFALAVYIARTFKT